MSEVAACRDLMMAYARCQDTRDAERFAALFTQDGTWMRSSGEYLEGRDAIAAFQAELFGNPAIRPDPMRHLITTCDIERIDAERCRGTTSALVYGVPEKPDQPGARLRALMDYHNAFQLTLEGWRIASHVGVLIPVGQG